MTIRLLGIVYEPAHFRSLLTATSRVSEDIDAETVLWCPYWLPQTEEFVAQARAAGQWYVAESTAAGGTADPEAQLDGLPDRPPFTASTADVNPPVIARLLSKVLWKAAPRAWGFRARFEAAWAAQRSRSDAIGHAIDLVRPDAIIMGEHNVERDSAEWVQQAGLREIPTIVLSYSTPSPHEAALAYADSPDHDARAGLNRVVGRALPRWRWDHRGHPMVRLPGATILARELAGLAPPEPWLLNSGDADVLLLESDRQRQEFARFGLSRPPVRVVGNALMDDIAATAAQRDAERRRLEEQWGVPLDETLLIVALPPDQYPSRPAPEFATYEDLVAAWLDLAEASGMAAVVSPHPNARGTVPVGRARNNVVVVDEGVADVLALGDAYLASVSSTIKWALLCGLTVVDYDVYRYGYDTWDDVDAVTQAPDLGATRAALADVRAALATDPDRRSAGVRIDPSWGQLDGGSSARLTAVIRELCSR